MKSKVNTYQIKPSPSFESIQEIVQDFMPDVILHLAASWKMGSEEDFLNQCISTNIDFASTLAKSALLNEVGFINIASYWELQLNEFELRSDHYTNSKRAFSNILAQMRMHYGFQYTTIYLFDNYGPNDTRGKLVSSLGRSIRDGTQITLRARNITLNLLHIEDVAVGLALAVENYSRFSTFEISNSHNFSLGEIVQLSESYIGQKIDLRWLETESTFPISPSHERLFPVPPTWVPGINFPERFQEIIKGA